jgi:hypothetical protein
MEVVVYRCSKCGVETDWDIALGVGVLCVGCWDRESDIVTKAGCKALYREEHKAEIKEYDRLYREKHRVEIAQRMRDYRLAHREKVRAYARWYYGCNGFKVREYQREYYLEHREKVVLRMRAYRKGGSGCYCRK